jgi:hypothetical protein
MNKAHLTILAVLFAASAVLGAVAVTRTTHLGAASRAAEDATVAAQTHQLNAYAASLKKQLRAKPPALPAVPKAAAVHSSASATPRIVYQQPPPIVVTVHRHGDDGSDEGGGGND